MEKYLLFGLVPIRVSANGTWTADVSAHEAGEGIANCLANGVSRGLLRIIEGVESVCGVHIPVLLTPLDQPLSSPG